MKRTTYSYFEATPSGGFLDIHTYEKSAQVMGRVCLDVVLILNNTLVLTERSIEPMKGAWPAGGRIRWEKFKDVYQYAAHTTKEHFGIVPKGSGMTVLEPRFICFKKRPYPEILIWVVVKISNNQYLKIFTNNHEHSGLIRFLTHKDLKKYLRQNTLSKEHKKIITHLWSDLIDKKLISK